MNFSKCFCDKVLNKTKDRFAKMKEEGIWHPLLFYSFRVSQENKNDTFLPDQFINDSKR